MTVIAVVKTELGRIRLVEDEGLFFTTRNFTSALDGKLLVSTIHISPAKAAEWYELAEEQGAVLAPFPVAVA